MGVSVGLIGLLCVSIWRLRSLDELPDIGDPFDVTEALRPVDLPDEQNAYAVYATANTGRLQLGKAFPKADFRTLTWSKAGPELRAFVEQQRPALEKWRMGSERPDALEFQPEQIVRSLWLVSNLTQDMWQLAHLAALEGSRREEAGAMSQAWDWYWALLRFSRLVQRHGGARWIGAQEHEWATNRILHWAADPRADVQQLRRTLEDTLAADALTPPLSEAIQFEYLVYFHRDWQQFLADFGRPPPPLPGGERGPLDQLAYLVGAGRLARMTWVRASNEVERSRRAIRLLYANWLAQVDRPAAKRAPVVVREPVWIYAADPTSPPAARAVNPKVLSQAIERNKLAQTLLFLDHSNKDLSDRSLPWEDNRASARERRRRSVLIVRLATELYRREHDAAPATTGALVGPYLKELPEGVATTDPIPSGIE
jgi:hypothetical protein